MITLKKKMLALVLSLSLAATLCMTACNAGEQAQQVADDVSNAVAQVLDGDVTGTIGREYETKWFTFTVDSMTTAQSYEDYTAADGNTLVIAHITETNVSGDTQPFGTFDWFVYDDSLSDYIYPLDPFTSDMMPASFDLDNEETVSYDVVIEYPASLENPHLTYIETDTSGKAYTTFKIAIA